MPNLNHHPSQMLLTRSRSLPTYCRTMPRVRLLVAAALMVVGVPVLAAGWSECFLPQSGPQTVNFGTVSDVGVAIGGPLTDKIIPAPAPTQAVPMSSPCAVGSGTLGIFNNEAPGWQGVYKTNIPGVGIIIYDEYIGETGWMVHRFPFSAYGTQWNGPGRYYVQLIKIATKIGSGRLTTGIIASQQQYNSGVIGRRIQITGGTIVGTPEPTCSLNPGDVNRTITLPSVMVRDFTGPTSVAGKKTFSIGVGGCTESVNTATFTFSGARDLADAWRFKNTGNANGVGLWLYSTPDNVTIRADGTNSARTVNVTNNQATLGLGAAYFQTGPKVTQGTFKSLVTVNVTYN